MLRKLATIKTLILLVGVVSSMLLVLATQTSTAHAAASPNQQAKTYCSKQKYNSSEKDVCINSFVAGYSNGSTATFSCPTSPVKLQEACHKSFDAGAKAAQSDDSGYCHKTDCHSGFGSSDPSCNKDKCDLIKRYLNPSITLLTVLFGLIAAGSLILGGIQFSTSEGDPQKAARAKDRIAGTILAVFAYAFLYAFLQFIIPGGLFNR